MFAAIIIAIVLLFGAGITYIWSVASQYEEDHPYIVLVTEETQKGVDNGSNRQYDHPH